MIEDMPSVPKDPDSLVTSFFESIQGHHLTAALDMMSQDCEYDNVPITKVFGRAAIEQTLGGFLAECSSYEWIIHHQVATGDLEHGVVMNERTDRFQIDGRWVNLTLLACSLSASQKLLCGATTLIARISPKHSPTNSSDRQSHNTGRVSSSQCFSS